MSNRPVVLVVMDGVGCTDKDNGNAVKHAYTPYLNSLLETCPHCCIKAHGTAVGLPSDDDMGNSEVGHNALGSGQIYSQGAKLVNESISNGSIYQTEVWKNIVRNNGDHTVHFLGLLSDGNVHSNIAHLKNMLTQAKKDGVKRVRVHILLDGRDVPATSAMTYVDDLENTLKELNDSAFDGKIASGGGRMYITMDRYEANWDMVKRGWYTHVLGEGRQFSSAAEAVNTYRKELNVVDQDMPEFVITEDGKPVGTIEDGDSVIFFNFRGDRALEITKAFEEKDFTKFDRKRYPNVTYAGMLQYDGDLNIPKLYLVNPPHIKNTLSEYLVANKKNQYAVSETQKFGHVTYFWNGNRSEKFDESLETWEEVHSDVIPFEQRPWMKSAEITDQLIEAIRTKKYDFLRTNYPNGDMVGHTGDYEATVIGVESVDLALGRLIKVIKETNAILIVTADHGNADEMYEKKKNPEDAPKPKTSHTLNPVPFIIYNADVELKDGNFGLSNVAATVVELLGLNVPQMWDESMLKK